MNKHFLTDRCVVLSLMLDVGVVDVFSAGVVHLKNSVAGTSFMCATGHVCLQSARVGVSIVSVFGPTDSFYY